MFKLITTRKKKPDFKGINWNSIISVFPKKDNEKQCILKKGRERGGGTWWKGGIVAGN